MTNKTVKIAEKAGFCFGVSRAVKITEDGIIKVIEISGMKFVLKSENAKKKYSYVFTIKASQANDDCSFKVLFSPQDGNFNNGKNKSFIAKYKFV